MVVHHKTWYIWIGKLLDRKVGLNIYMFVVKRKENYEMSYMDATIGADKQQERPRVKKIPGGKKAK